jgi:hypothetical protein
VKDPTVAAVSCGDGDPTWVETVPMSANCRVESAERDPDKKIEKESAVYRRTALFLRDFSNFRWQTSNTDNSGQKQRKARYTSRDKTGDKILKKAAVRTTWVESPYHIP